MNTIATHQIRNAETISQAFVVPFSELDEETFEELKTKCKQIEEENSLSWVEEEIDETICAEVTFKIKWKTRHFTLS